MGEKGIRTLDIDKQYNRLAICRFRPLSHPSIPLKKQTKNQNSHRTQLIFVINS